TVTFQDKKFTMEDDNLQDAMLSLANETKILTDVPVGFSLVKNRFVGVYGGYANVVNMVKSFVIQMIALHSYDELKVMLITDATDKDEWDFVRYIPHFWNNEKTVRFLASSDDEVKELSAYMDKAIVSRGDKDEGGDYAENSPYYVLISTGKEASERCEALQQLIKFKGNCGFSVLYMAEELKDFPKETNVVIYANGAESKMYDRNDTSGKITVFSADRINENSMESISEDIANIQLDLSSQRYALPNMITFLEMFNVSKIEHLNPLLRWKENNPCNTLQTPVGVDTSGNLFYLDLHERYHGPHGLVAGMTGSGKSEFIITYILSLAVNFHPDEVAFILIDYKGGGLTGAFEDSEKGIKLPHLAGTITNLDGAAVKRSLISIQSELRRRQAIFNEARRISNEGTMDIYKYQQLYRDGVMSEPVPHLFIISDEFAELKTQQPEFMEQLISAARIGRSLGVHLILATQKPSGVVDDQIWSNSKFRVCLKVQDKSDSQDMIKRPDAAELSQTGRFYLQVGFNEFFALGQSAWCGAEYVPTETVEKSVDESISVIDNLGRTRMKLKPKKKVVRTGPKLKQIVSIVKYLSDIAVEEEISVRPLWLDPIPEFITVDGIEKKYSKTTSGLVLSPVVGEYDDPFNQRQDALVLPISQDGNCLVYGSTGNGKTTFLTSVAYSLIKNHTADEVNIYIMDFGAETLKMFSRAPQVGGVVVSADEEETVNLLKLLTKALEDRKALFSKYGGDYASYCKNSGSTLPNIVVMINNYTGFAEQYEDYGEVFNLLVRDGTKYGIYFVVTASGANAVRYRTAQNFKITLTMQLNDPSDYPVIVGKTEGVIPSKYKGRGLVSFGKVHEFQTAYCTLEDDKQQFIRNFCENLREKASSFAVPIPVLPEKVDYEFVKASVTGLDSVPVGIAKKSLQVVSVNLDNKVIYPVSANESELFPAFVSGLSQVVSQLSFVCLVDSRNEIKSTDSFNEVIRGNYDDYVQSLFDEMVLRNNTYKDAKMNV
ncbi:MAG: type VII secretion protein EssC, partial [Clostridia bacterium]|nr:type VII secretion protein EssC [Clostridia bacterium]